MKKKLSFLCALLLLTASVTMGQNYQFPYNGQFEYWTSTGSNDAVPKGWQSFNTAQCELFIGCNSAKTNHSNRVDGHDGGYGLEIYCKFVSF